jgi:hypothetical protein
VNQYGKEFNELRKENSFRGMQWFGKRQSLVEEYGWAIPSEEALIYLAEFDELLSVGAGRAYWEHLLEQRGVDIRATDIIPPEETWTTVEQENVYNIDPTDVPILTIWPPLGGDVAATVARKGAPQIVYIGESRGGCTASDEFFDLVEKKYGLIAEIELPSYVGVHDNLYHYVRNT